MNLFLDFFKKSEFTNDIDKGKNVVFTALTLMVFSILCLVVPHFLGVERELICYNGVPNIERDFAQWYDFFMSFYYQAVVGFLMMISVYFYFDFLGSKYSKEKEEKYLFFGISAFLMALLKTTVFIYLLKVVISCKNISQIV